MEYINFRADHAIGGEQYITIGNFYPDSTTDTVNINNNTNLVCTGYYIDDVSVVDCTGSGIGVEELGIKNEELGIRNDESRSANSSFITHHSSLKILPDLILSDVMMPIMDGFQLLSELKSNDAYCSIPVVMLTARAELQDKLKALRIGVDDYLVKPFEEEELFARINNLLRNSQARQTVVQETDMLLVDNEEGLDMSEKGKNTEGYVSTPTISVVDRTWLIELETAVKGNLKDVNYSVERMASDIALSRTQLFRKLKHLTGLSPQQYLQEARLQHALYLLETNQVTTVKNACYDVGLLQVKHFSQLFHERFGKLPSAYLV